MSRGRKPLDLSIDGWQIPLMQVCSQCGTERRCNRKQWMKDFHSKHSNDSNDSNDSDKSPQELFESYRCVSCKGGRGRRPIGSTKTYFAKQEKKPCKPVLKGLPQRENAPFNYQLKNFMTQLGVLFKGNYFIIQMMNGQSLPDISQFDAIVDIKTGKKIKGNQSKSKWEGKPAHMLDNWEYVKNYYSESISEK